MSMWRFPQPGRDDHEWFGAARLLAVARIFNKDPSKCQSFMDHDDALNKVKEIGSSYSPECRQLSEDLLTGAKMTDENTATEVKDKCGDDPYTMRAFIKSRIDAQKESYGRGICPDGGFDFSAGHMYSGDDTFHDKVQIHVFMIKSQ